MNFRSLLLTIFISSGIIAQQFKHDFVEGYHNLANVLKESNKFEEAETNYKKAIESIYEIFLSNTLRHYCCFERL